MGFNKFLDQNIALIKEPTRLLGSPKLNFFCYYYVYGWMYNLIYTTNVILALYEYILQPQTTSSFREA